MNLLDIEKKVKNIKLIKGDDELAHSKEDDLYEEFIRFISERDDDIGEMAKAILATKTISFARWCA